MPFIAMNALQVFGALQVLDNLDDAEEDDEMNNRRFLDNVEKNAFTELTDDQFIQYFRLSKELTHNLIELLTPHMNIPARPRRLFIQKKVLTALRFFATGSYQGITGSDAYVYVSQSSVSRSIHSVIDALNQQEILDEYVKFPRNIDEMEASQNRFFNRFQFPGIVGCIDCTHVAIIAPPNNDDQHPEHIYVNRKNYHSINVQLICDENLKILNVDARFPGSAHDSRIWNQSPVCQVMEGLYRHFPNRKFFLLGDSGYPLRPWLQTPIRNPEPNTPEERYNNQFVRIRSLIERCNGVLKQRFRCLLKHRTLHYTPNTASKIINSCVILHNMCINANLPIDENEEIDLGNFNNYQPVQMEEGNNDLEAGRAIRRDIINNYFN